MAEDKDSPDDIGIPSLFLYYKEGQQLLMALSKRPTVVLRLSTDPLVSGGWNSYFFSCRSYESFCCPPKLSHLEVSLADCIKLRFDLNKNRGEQELYRLCPFRFSHTRGAWELPHDDVFSLCFFQGL